MSDGQYPGRGIRLVFSVDVEEEGLFSGDYDSTAKGVSNVESLSRLEFLTRDFDLPLTLLCTWPVLTDFNCARLLRRWQDDLGAEIGVHLHPWNTPPMGKKSMDWTSSQKLGRKVLDAKLGELVRVCRAVTDRPPTSFRMGRFDLSPAIRDLLPAHELLVDSSIVPLSWTAALNDAFLATADPYPLLRDDAGQARLLEVPLTMAALSPCLSAAVWPLAKRLAPHMRSWFFRHFQRIAAVGTQPVWYPLPSMKLGARLHMSRGGTLVHLFLHSSELMPGACPHLPDEAAVERLVTRVRRFIIWLRTYVCDHGGLHGVTLGYVAKEAGLVPRQEAQP